MQYSLEKLNAMSQTKFTQVLGDIWEDTPEIAANSWFSRPFTDFDDLYNSMVKIVEEMSQEKQLALIKAHPDLGSKAKMAEASVKEQAGVGLDRLNSEEYNRLLSLNQEYKAKFDFPFIIAVKSHTLESIFQSFTERLKNNLSAEKTAALSEIKKIARFRLDEVILNGDLP
ncbi:MAG: 2-oxo-4-hydroxy-4-carboxy-5-ureidoimidazoline decarboxylase [Xenococcaceae cyanobacterium]